MADLWGQFGNEISGASDSWDEGVAGLILSEDYFPTEAPGGLVSVWTGSAWVRKPIKAWSGSAWLVGLLKRWTGTEWQLT